MPGTPRAREGESVVERGMPRNTLCAALVSACLALAAFPAASAPGQAKDQRLARKVQVMERVLDEVLVLSKHVVVAARGTTRGLVLDEFGALFTLEASPGANRMNLAAAAAYRMDYLRQRQEALLQTPEPPEPPESKPLEGRKPQDRLDLPDPDAAWREKSEQERKEDIEAFGEEIIDTLLDYGPTLSELGDTQWVAVVAFLDSRSLFGGGDEQRLLYKVKMGDLRQYSSGKISRESARKKVTVDEQ